MAFFVAAFGILTLLMRPARPGPGALEGVPPAPSRGVEVKASLTRMEEEAARPRPAVIKPPLPPDTPKTDPGIRPKVVSPRDTIAGGIRLADLEKKDPGDR